MADTHAKHHDYHLVDPSKWPAVGAISAFILAIGAITWMRTEGGGLDFTDLHVIRPLYFHCRLARRICSRWPAGGATS